MKKTDFFIQCALLVLAAILALYSFFESDIFSLIAILQLITGVYQILSFLLFISFGKSKDRVTSMILVYVLMAVAVFLLIYLAYNSRVEYLTSRGDIILFVLPWIPAIYYCYLTYVVAYRKFSANGVRHFLDL